MVSLDLALMAVLAIAGVLALFAIGRFVLEIGEGADPDDAFRRSGESVALLVGGVLTLLFTGAFTLATWIDGLGGAVAEAPAAFIAGVLGLLGWIGLTGLVEVGPTLWLIVVLAVLAAVLLAREVKARA